MTLRNPPADGSGRNIPAPITRAQVIEFCETAFRNMPEGTDFLPIINALDDGRGFETAMNKIGFSRKER